MIKREWLSGALPTIPRCDACLLHIITGGAVTATPVKGEQIAEAAAQKESDGQATTGLRSIKSSEGIFAGV